jgi:phosphoribosyl-AMP cyclohydrolase
MVLPILSAIRGGGWTHPARRLTFSRPGTKTLAMNDQLNSLKYDSTGLIPCVVQDIVNGEVLMVAWMNREALEKTLATGKIHTYSRSRGRLALKGEQSGHFQHVRAMFTDCDRDVVLFKVEQVVAACHEGYRSCFYRQYQPTGSSWQIVGKRAFDPEKTYKK